MDSQTVTINRAYTASSATATHQRSLGPLIRKNPPKFLFLMPIPFSKGIIPKISLKKYSSLELYACQAISAQGAYEMGLPPSQAAAACEIVTVKSPLLMTSIIEAARTFQVPTSISRRHLRPTNS